MSTSWSGRGVMGLDCRVEVRAATADGIAALARLKGAAPEPLSVQAEVSVNSFGLTPGLHETFAALVMAIRWSDLAYGAAGSLIATGIVALGAEVLKARPPAASDVRGQTTDAPTTAHIEMADEHSILRIELTGYEGQATAEVLREILSRDPS